MEIQGEIDHFQEVLVHECKDAMGEIIDVQSCDQAEEEETQNCTYSKEKRKFNWHNRLRPLSKILELSMILFLGAVKNGKLEQL